MYDITRIIPTTNKNWLWLKASAIFPSNNELTKCVPPQVTHFPPYLVQAQTVLVESIRSLNFAQKNIIGTANTSATIIKIPNNFLFFESNIFNKKNQAPNIAKIIVKPTVKPYIIM